MDNIPEDLRQRLIHGGYDRIGRLPNEKNDARWNDVRTDCGFSRPELNEVINALFPAPSPSGLVLQEETIKALGDLIVNGVITAMRAKPHRRVTLSDSQSNVDTPVPLPNGCIQVATNPARYMEQADYIEAVRYYELFQESLRMKYCDLARNPTTGMITVMGGSSN